MKGDRDVGSMDALLRFFRRPPTLDPTERERLGARLNAQRRHLRSRLAHHQRTLHRLYTDYRRTGDRDVRRDLKTQIRAVEAERKEDRKRMAHVAREMAKLGYQAKAGHVDLH